MTLANPTAGGSSYAIAAFCMFSACAPYPTEREVPDTTAKVLGEFQGCSVVVPEPLNDDQYSKVTVNFPPRASMAWAALVQRFIMT